MCDYSLKAVRSRAARKGDKLITRDFGTGTRGFAPIGDVNTAVCVLPGSEISFEKAVLKADGNTIGPAVAIFRQVNTHDAHVHHDALEFPDGSKVLLTALAENQYADVLQLPAPPKTAAEAQAQKRLPIDA